MTTTENTTTDTTTHEETCRTNQETPTGGFDWGCTCNWTEDDEHTLRRWTD